MSKQARQQLGPKPMASLNRHQRARQPLAHAQHGPAALRFVAGGRLAPRRREPRLGDHPGDLGRLVGGRVGVD